MRLVELETTGVRGLRDASFHLEPDRNGPGHVTVVTGPPHAGLTTFLDAIAMSVAKLAVGGVSPNAADILRAGGSTAMVRSTWWLDADERAYGGMKEETALAEVIFKRDELGRADADPGLLGLMSRYDHSPTLSKVVLIPARRVTDASVPSFLDFEMDQQYKHLSDSPDKFAGVPNALIRHATGFGEKARFEDAQRLFDEMCGGAVRLAPVGPIAQPQFSLATGMRVTRERLSFMERNAFVLAALPPLCGLQRSVILLDTPELGLPAGVAARWVDALRRYAPEAQWIIATRDPAVIAAVEPAARVELAARGAA